MDPFIEQIRIWQPFYATVAAACSTLTGLLFVALSMNMNILRRAENSERMWLARQTFSEFLLVLMVSLIFLIPGLGPLGLGVSLLCLGGAWAFSALNTFQTRFRQYGMNKARFLRTFGLSLAGTFGLIITAVCMLLGYTVALYGLVFMLAALLASASRNAWALLVEVHEDRTSAAQKK